MKHTLIKAVIGISLALFAIGCSDGGGAPCPINEVENISLG